LSMIAQAFPRHKLLRTAETTRELIRVHRLVRQQWQSAGLSIRAGESRFAPKIQIALSNALGGQQHRFSPRTRPRGPPQDFCSKMISGQYLTRTIVGTGSSSHHVSRRNRRAAGRPMRRSSASSWCREKAGAHTSRGERRQCFERRRLLVWRPLVHDGRAPERGFF
jgi:hypothetical protein